jgi:WXG100 family type VII secretion target
MAKISVTPEQLKAQAKIYTTAKNEIESAMKKIERTNKEVETQWQGAAFKAYLQQFAQMKKNVQQLENLLVDVNKQLDKYAQTIAERDAQDAKSFGF